MSKQKTIQVSKQCYKKSFLHSCKYSNDDVLGVLIGNIQGLHYQVEDAYPLFHSHILQAPLEIALDLIQSNLSNGQNIIGVYESRVSKLNGQILSDTASEIIDQISLHQGKKEAIYLKIVEIEDDDDFSKLIAKVDYLLFIDQIKNIQLYKFWIGQEQVKPEQESQLDYSIIQDSLTQGLHWKIIDLDAHFENISLDFNNKFIE